jgi:hypothetical protein
MPYFRRCALFTPNMHGMVPRDGVLGAGKPGTVA